MVSGAQPNPSGIAFHFTSASRTDSLFSRSMDVPTRHAATGQDTLQWHYESHAQPRSKCCLHAARRVATVLMVDPAWAGSASRSAMDTKKRSCDGQAIAVPGKIAVGTSMQAPFRGPASAVPARRGFRRAGWVRRQAPEPSHAGNAASGKRGPGRCRTTGGGRSSRAQDAAPAGTSQQRRGHARKEPQPCSGLPTAAAVAFRTTGPRRQAAGRTVLHRGLEPAPTTDRAVSPAVMASLRSPDAWPLPHGHAQDRRRLPQALDGQAGCSDAQHPHRSRRCVAVHLGARVGGWVLLVAGRHADPPVLAVWERRHWLPVGVHPHTIFWAVVAAIGRDRC